MPRKSFIKAELDFRACLSVDRDWENYKNRSFFIFRENVAMLKTKRYAVPCASAKATATRGWNSLISIILKRDSRPFQ